MYVSINHDFPKQGSLFFVSPSPLLDILGLFLKYSNPISILCPTTSWKDMPIPVKALVIL